MLIFTVHAAVACCSACYLRGEGLQEGRLVLVANELAGLFSLLGDQDGCLGVPPCMAALDVLLCVAAWPSSRPGCLGNHGGGAGHFHEISLLTGLVLASWLCKGTAREKYFPALMSGRVVLSGSRYSWALS